MQPLRRLPLTLLPTCCSESLGHTQHGGGTPGAGGGASAPSRLFATDNFVDRTSAEGRFDFSEWVRAYGKYLEEQVGGWGWLQKGRREGEMPLLGRARQADGGWG